MKMNLRIWLRVLISRTRSPAGGCAYAGECHATGRQRRCGGAIVRRLVSLAKYASEMLRNGVLESWLRSLFGGARYRSQFANALYQVPKICLRVWIVDISSHHTRDNQKQVHQAARLICLKSMLLRGLIGGGTFNESTSVAVHTLCLRSVPTMAARELSRWSLLRENIGSKR
jgi:hypothetical protein